VIWLIEERGGPLMYTITVNEKGVSIAEGLKPIKQSPLPDELAQSFMKEQLSAFPDSTTVRTPKSGESYSIGGQSFVCTESEFVALDEPNGLLVVWARTNPKSVMAVTKEWLMRAKK
jgi:hypothetical protein